MLPKNTYFWAFPKKMRNVLSNIITKSTKIRILYAHLKEQFIDSKISMKNFKLEIPQFGG
jgi:hypothetical protein